MGENSFYNMKCLLTETSSLESGEITKEKTKILIKLHYQLIIEASKIYG